MRKGVPNAICAGTASVKVGVKTQKDILNMVVYTKKGDGGTTGLFGNTKRVSKFSQIVRAIGAVDEANSYLGVCLSELRLQPKPGGKLTNTLQSIQKDLFVVGSILAGAKNKLPSCKIYEMEQEIDRLETKLPAQKNFILPGGTRMAAHLMFARTLVRRAEREATALKGDSRFHIQNFIFRYLNRLSDFLFILARKENSDNKILETVWNVQ